MVFGDFDAETGILDQYLILVLLIGVPLQIMTIIIHPDNSWRT